jgi:hypothetical protein
MTNSTRRRWRVSVTPRSLFTPGKDPVPIVQEAGWAPGPVWTGADNLASTGIRSPDLPVLSQSLYPLSYSAHSYNNILRLKFYKNFWRVSHSCCLVFLLIGSPNSTWRKSKLNFVAVRSSLSVRHFPSTAPKYCPLHSSVFISCPINDTVSSSDSIASNGRTIMHHELNSARKGAISA